MEKDKLTPVEKAMLIMETMANHPDELKVAEISEITKINRTTVHRILRELLAKDWVIQNFKTGKYIVGPMAFHVGMAYTNNNNIEPKIMEVLDYLSEELKESVGYAVREGDRVISLYETEVHQPFKLNYHPGQFYPMNCGGYGKCLYAYHDQERVMQMLREQTFEKCGPNTMTDPEEILKEYAKTRERGYAISDEEATAMMIGVGVPVFNQNGEVKGCLGCAFIKSDDKTEKSERFVKILQAGAEQLARYMP